MWHSWVHVRVCPLACEEGKLMLRAGDPRLLYGRPAQPAQMGATAQPPQQQQQYNAYSAAASAPGYVQPVDPRRAVPSDPRLSSAPGTALLDVNAVCDMLRMRAWALRATVPACSGLLSPEGSCQWAFSYCCYSVQLRRKCPISRLRGPQMCEGPLRLIAAPLGSRDYGDDVRD